MKTQEVIVAEEQPNGQAPAGSEAGQAPVVTEQETFDGEYVKGLRAENAKWRKQAQEAAAKAAEYERAQMTEAERLQAQAKAAQEAAAAAQAELRQSRAEVAVARAAAREGVNPTLLGRLVEVQFDDAGQPVDVEAAVAAVLKEYPQLKAPPVQLAATNPGRTTKLTLEDVKKMSPQEIIAHEKEIDALLAGGR
jgi:hypothetical protein